MVWDNLICNIIISTIGPLVGALIGGYISYKTTQYSLKQETRNNICELLLVIRENRKKMRKIYSEIDALKQKNLDDNVYCQSLKLAACKEENRLGEVESVWQQKRSLTYIVYGDANYSCLQKIVNQFNYLNKLQSEQIKKNGMLCNMGSNAQNEDANNKCGNIENSAQTDKSEADEEPQVLVDPVKDINAKFFQKIYQETEEMFDNIPSKELSDYLRI